MPIPWKGLGDAEKRAIETALPIAIEEYQKHAAEMENIARLLRAGEDVPPFMRGESGAIAADRLAEQFRRQVKDAESAYEKIECAYQLGYLNED